MKFIRYSILFLCTSALLNPLIGQEIVNQYSKEELIEVSRKIIESTNNCALITLDEDGNARVRAMDPFMPDENMIVWFGTNPNSRKVSQIKENPNVTLYYIDQDGSGYVIIMGKASLVDNPEMKKDKWKDEWTEFYPDREKDYMLIKVIPETLEVLSTKHGILANEKTWTPPSVKF